jgi:hypothetical protein
MVTISINTKKHIARLLLCIFVFQILSPTQLMALTGGPSQPEMQAFQPAGTTDMVDLFSGDFNYNIPLFELPGPNGGYPFSLSYQSGVTLDQEASWVGLGWSLNPGAITRQMRGLPDDFRGDPINTKMSVKPSVTAGLGVGGSLEIFGAAKEVAGLGLSVFFNNYKGFGYSIDGTIGTPASKSGMTAGVGLGISLNSQEGVNVSPSLSLSGKVGEFGLRAGYNSRSGLDQVSMGYTAAAYSQIKGQKELAKSSFGGVYSSMSLAYPGYTPQINMPMNNISLSAKINTGASLMGVFGKAYIKGFYAEQRLKFDKQTVTANGYGYAYSEKGQTDTNGVLDFNREKDGIISKETANLGIPSMTYDIYSVTGQGGSATYRPVRNDIGVLHDREVTSESSGGSIGADAGPLFAHIGVNLSVNHSRSSSGAWTANNSMASLAAFENMKVDDAFEPWNFKAHGEMTGENAAFFNKIGGSDPVRVRLEGANSQSTASTTLENKNWNQPLTASNLDRTRKQRNQVIQPLTNDQVRSAQGEMVSFYKNKYINAAGSEVNFDRSSPLLPGHHFAGFTSLTPEGLRYNYTIPVYNLLQEEVLFTAVKSPNTTSKVFVLGGPEDPTFDGDPNTEQFLKKVQLPKYAHSYLLTSVLGADYVDRTGDGVTDDDLGYWVKFTYQKTTTDGDPYKWRDPFMKAHYQEGWKTDFRDDKGSYTYGEKDLWYLARAETKSHIAAFTIEKRRDAKGVLWKIQNDTLTGKSAHRLKQIKLYSKTGTVLNPIKAVNFCYEYSLCPGVFNNPTDAAHGKLTLTKVWFEYGNATRGPLNLNPYQFTYHTNNPAYDQHAYDRWGNYKRYVGDYYTNIDFPYAEQDPLKKVTIDADAGSWSLTQIQLPSGGKIIVDYESDDYGYVQHKQAMQMTSIVNPYVASDQAASSPDEFILTDNTKIRFKLEQTLPGTPVILAPQQQAIVLSYLDQVRKQVFFKIKINLRSASEDFQEFISGYADVDLTPLTGIPAMTLEKDAAGNYAWGTFRLIPESSSTYHPFSMRAWQHLRTNQPDLASVGRKLSATNDNAVRVGQLRSLTSVFLDVQQMFAGFYNFCSGRSWGREIVASKSWIRLNSPDKIKYGGGARVSQITIKDNWQNDQEGVYGQVYDYTRDENGKTISSGVAAYEPIVGGEENSLRYAKKYTQSVPLRSDNNLFFEYPVNESYYPGPHVGYSKVTVTSLASAALAGKTVKNVTLTDGQSLFPSGTGVTYGTTGKTVHEFYTAKDFPVIAGETEKFDAPFNLSVPIPFLGNVSVSKLTTTQGYSIVTNDMHGKPKQVSVYRQDKFGGFEPDPISWVKYNYSSESKVYQSEMVSSLTSLMKDNGDGTLSVPTSGQSGDYTMGQENEFFIDMRQYEDNAWEGGANLNTDLVSIPLLFALTIPVPTIWPSISKSTSQLRSAVTNKIIFRPGILESTEAYDGGSLVKTQNLKWDKLTGQVILTRVNNNYDNPVFGYSVPAYTQYQGMSAAYQNVGLAFKVRGVTLTTTNQYMFTSSVDNTLLYPGDEVILYTDDAMTLPAGKVTYIGQRAGINRFSSNVALTQTTYTALIVRSGFRNQLNVTAGTITALQDPSVPGADVVYTKTLVVPNN